MIRTFHGKGGAEMNKLTTLAEAAKAAATIDHNEQEGWYSAEVIREQGAYFPKNAKFIAACDPDTILELCDLVVELEEVLRELSFGRFPKEGDEYSDDSMRLFARDALAAIKQWKDQA